MSGKSKSSDKTGRGGKATIIDVGRLAEVSPKTVSRVINEHAAVGPSTRERVKAAMKALDFRPNLAARSLRSARSYNIGLLTTDISNYYFSEVVRGAARACAAREYHLLIDESVPDGGTPAALDNILGQIKVDGFILPPPLADTMARLDALDRRGARYVRISPASNPERSPYVMSDDASGVRALANHLWALGHRRFGHVAGPPDHAATHIRRESFTRALLDAGADRGDIFQFELPQDVLLKAKSRWTGRLAAEAGVNAVDALVAMSQPPTALFAFSDEFASGAVARAHQLGLTVPGQLAIAGFDDSDIGQIVHPPLTTIRQPIAEMMEDAVRHLTEADVTRQMRPHPVELLVRGSTAPGLSHRDAAPLPRAKTGAIGK